MARLTFVRASALVLAAALVLSGCEGAPRQVPAAGSAAQRALERAKSVNMTEEDKQMMGFLRRVTRSADARVQAREEPDGWFLKTCAGWSALTLCGAVFGAGIDEEVGRREDVSPLFGSAAESRVDYARQAVDSFCLWNDDPTLKTQYTAIYREGLGCTLTNGYTEAELRAQDVGVQRPPGGPLDPNVAWPVGGAGPIAAPPGVDMQCIGRVLDEEFSDEVRNSRAVTVVRRGELIAERYAPTVDEHTRLIGWSATKSIVNMFMGILSGDGLVDVFARAPVPEWQADNRSAITLDEMLHMNSGVPWGVDPLTTTWCLYDSDGDCAGYATNPEFFPLDTTPGDRYEYNSGSSYIMSRIVNTVRGEPEWNNFEWPKRRLWWPISAHSFYIEYQGNQHFLGGASGYATARDWARFGLLMLRDGLWVDGRRIFPQGWLAYSSTGSAASPGYGAHWRKGVDVDPALIYGTGFRDEKVFVFPTQDIVITRHAMPDPILGMGWNQNNFLNGMLSCFDATNTTE